MTLEIIEDFSLILCLKLSMFFADLSSGGRLFHNLGPRYEISGSYTFKLSFSKETAYVLRYIDLSIYYDLTSLGNLGVLAP